MRRAPSTNAGQRATVGEHARSVPFASGIYGRSSKKGRPHTPGHTTPYPTAPSIHYCRRRRRRGDAYSHVKVVRVGGGGVVDDGEGVGGSGERVRVREWRYQWMDGFMVADV